MFALQIYKQNPLNFQLRFRLYQALHDTKLVVVFILYSILTIPLFGFDFYKAPRQYYPKEWYDRYDPSNEVSVTLPYKFEYKETEELSDKAFNLSESKKYTEAILIYQTARKLEPSNPRLLFEMAETYARDNELEIAILCLDTAIMLDNSYPGFFNNRGLLYYKLKENKKSIEDYKAAIQLDSSQFSFYANLALVYYNEEMINEACEALIKAKQLGLNMSGNNELERLNYKYCN